MLGVESLADQLAGHVGEGDDHGVDLARGDGALQSLERQHATHTNPPRFSAAILAPC